jgi:glutamine amidotransferase
MCRLIAVHDRSPFSIDEMLRPLAIIARASKEFQGDGWGCAWWDGASWARHRSIRPIWEDPLTGFGSTTVLLGHARSAYRNEGVAIENNMPFLDAASAFVFNGELRGVKISAGNGIGAAKLFRFLREMGAETGLPRLRHAVEIVRRRSDYVRALNFVVATGPVLRVGSWFNEDPDYFTMHWKRELGRTVVSSEPFRSESGWEPIANGTALEVS